MHKGERAHDQGQPRPLHAERIQDEDDGDRIVSQLGDCRAAYLKLEDCLCDHNRDWKKCQEQVSALRECQEKNRKEHR